LQGEKVKARVCTLSFALSTRLHYLSDGVLPQDIAMLPPSEWRWSICHSQMQQRLSVPDL